MPHIEFYDWQQPDCTGVLMRSISSITSVFSMQSLFLVLCSPGCCPAHNQAMSFVMILLQIGHGHPCLELACMLIYAAVKFVVLASVKPLVSIVGIPVYCSA